MFFARGRCFPKNDPPSMLEIPQSSTDPPFLSKTSNATAKKGNAKAKMAIIRFMNSIILDTIEEPGLDTHKVDALPGVTEPSGSNTGAAWRALDGGALPHGLVGHEGRFVPLDLGDPASNSIRRNQLVGGCVGVSKKEPQHFA